MVILAHLDDRESADYLDRVDLEPVWGQARGAAALRDRLAQTRVQGYAVNPGLIVPGSWAWRPRCSTAGAGQSGP